MFKQGKFDIKEFQSRVLTASIPDNISKTYILSLTDFDNTIEKLIYCMSENDYKQYGDRATDDLILATIMEKNRLQNS